MAILCLCSVIHRTAVISHSFISIANLRLNVVKRSFYLQLKLVYSNCPRNQRKWVWTERDHSATHQPNPLWTVTEQRQQVSAAWQRFSTIDKCSKERTKLYEVGGIMSTNRIKARIRAHKHNWTSSGARNNGRIERASAVASTRSARLLYNRASSEAPLFYFNVGGDSVAFGKLRVFVLCESRSR